MNYSNEPRALYALCRCLPWWCVCVCVCVRCVCVQTLYGTLVDLNDIALRLFMMGAELNGEKKKNRMRSEGLWWRCNRGEEIPVDFVFFFFPPRLRKRDGELESHLKTFPRLPSFHLHPRSSSLHFFSPSFYFSHRRSLFMLWTANRWAELFRGLNYVVILGFLLSLPLFFLPSRVQAFYLGGRQGCFVFSPPPEGGKERRRAEEERWGSGGRGWNKTLSEDTKSWER